MSLLNRSTLKTNLPTVIFPNTTGLIDASAHQSLLEDILDSSVNLLTDKPLLNLRSYNPSKSYDIGETTVFDSGGGNQIYIANTATTGAFNASDWDVITSGGGGGGISSVNGDSGPAVVLDSDDISEGITNLYFNENRVLLTDLSGLTISGGPVTATDDVRTAIGALQNQINGIPTISGTVGALPVYDTTTSFTDSVFKQDNGTLAFSIGDGSVNPDNESVVIGKNANTTSGTKGTQYVLIGLNAGDGTDNIGTESVNIGSGSTAQLAGSITVGRNNINSTGSGIAIGENISCTGGSFGVSIGSAVTSLNGGIVTGRSSEALSGDACAYGLSAAARSVGQVSMGNNSGNTSGTSGTHAICVGTNAETTKNIGSTAIIMGLNAENAGTRGISLGQSAGNTTGTYGNENINIGYLSNSGTTNVGINNVAIGSLCDTESNYGISVGLQSICRGSQQISIGYRAGNTTGTHGSRSITMGVDANNGADNIGQNSIAIGPFADSIGTDSQAFGRSVVCDASGALGMGNTFTNSTANSMAFGWNGSIAWRFGINSGLAPALPTFADETAAATGGLTTGEMYINSSTRALTIKA